MKKVLNGTGSIKKLLKGMGICTLAIAVLCALGSMLILWEILDQKQIGTAACFCYGAGMLLGVMLLLKREKENRLLIAGLTAAGEMLLLFLINLALLPGKPAGGLPIVILSAGTAVIACVLSGSAGKPKRRTAPRRR